MFLKEIYLKNYKCFEEKTLSFKERFTVLIGENGSGKTAVLDGIARAFSHFRKGVLDDERYDFTAWEASEIRHVSHKAGSKSSLEKQIPYQFKATVLNQQGKQLEWHMGNSGGNPQAIEKYGKELKVAVANGGVPTLPLVVYYQTSRRWSNEKYASIDLFPIRSRTQVYKDCLAPSLSSKIIFEWFKRMTIIQFQKSIFPPELKAVREAIIKALEGLRKDKRGIVEAYFSAENDELMIDIGDGNEFLFILLSEGYRNTLGLIADIAYRMAELNPHVTTDTPGVVLIDEIDLHLHPKWQRIIVGDLKRIFPNCQFIVTTHSPFIIQSLKAEELIRLDDEMEIEKDPLRESIEDVTENYMGVDEVERSVQFKKMEQVASEYFALVAQGQKEKDSKKVKSLKKKLDELELQYSDDPAYVALMKAERTSQPVKL